MLSPASPVKVSVAPTGAFLSTQIDMPAVPVGGSLVARGAVSVTLGAVADPVHALLQNPGPWSASPTLVFVAADEIVRQGGAVQAAVTELTIPVIVVPAGIPSPLMALPTEILDDGNCCRLLIVVGLTRLLTSP